MVGTSHSFLTSEQIIQLGFNFVGDNVKISKDAKFYGSSFISIASNSRIDDFCILSASERGLISIGNYVHISTGVFLYGSSGIEIGNFVGISSGVKIYSASDDYSGEFMTNPMIPNELRNVISGRVVLSDHTIIGASSVILPGVHIGESSAVGAMSLVTKSLQPFGIYAGIPVKKIGIRKKNHVEMAINLRETLEEFR